MPNYDNKIVLVEDDYGRLIDCYALNTSTGEKTYLPVMGVEMDQSPRDVARYKVTLARTHVVTEARA